MSNRTRNVSIRLPASKKGHSPLKCPRSDCAPGEFLVHPRTGKPETGDTVTCPYCGHSAPTNEFRHPIVAQHIEQQKDWEVKRFAGDILDELLAPLQRTLDKIQRSTADGPISMRFEMTRSGEGAGAQPERPVPPDLLRDVMCDACGTGYEVFVMALFCPGCGAPHLSVHVDREAVLIAKQLGDAAALAETGELERATRAIGNACEDVASVIEAHLKSLFAHVIAARYPVPKAADIVLSIGNEFQSSQRGRKRFVEIGFDPYSVLDADELAFLDEMMSKRHVVTHNLGAVDRRFVARCREAKPGMNVPLDPADVLRGVELHRRIVLHCERGLPELAGRRR